MLKKTHIAIIRILFHLADRPIIKLPARQPNIFFLRDISFISSKISQRKWKNKHSISLTPAERSTVRGITKSCMQCIMGLEINWTDSVPYRGMKHILFYKVKLEMMVK